MKRIEYACLALASLLGVGPVFAITNDNGDILITAAAVNAGGITPGDTAGFPVTISLPGTYRLATNLTVTTAVNGIEVRANEVTIEMGGHTLAGSGAGRNGIASFNRAATVRNGIVRGFTNDGIRSIAQFLTVADMIVAANGRTGVFADWESTGLVTGAVALASVTGSKISSNGAYGIQCGEACRVENTSVWGNGGTGLYFKGTGGLALGNIVTNNPGGGIFFWSYGGAGNNTVSGNGDGPQITGSYIPMQPNACIPTCPPPNG